MSMCLRGGLAGVVAALALVVWFGPYAHGRYIDGEIVDTPVYANYLTLVDHGQVPYRDFAVEYPPLAFVPWLAAWQGDEPEPVYRRRFRTEIGLLVALCAATVTLTSVTLRRGALRSVTAGVTVAAAPLAIGSVIAARYATISLDTVRYQA